MRKFVIERGIDGVGRMSAEDLCEAARASNAALARLAPGVQWQHSYVTGDKTFCVYLAESEEAVRKHAELSGFPADTVTEVTTVIDPTTAG